jgi:iron complex transport system substrate-binding protein
VTSSTFIGQVYALLGMENIADPADPEGTGYPQLSAEYIVAQDPDMVFLADADFGESAESLAARPGWEGMSALESGAVVELDADIASRWGPRIVDFLRTVADAVQRHSPSV